MRQMSVLTTLLVLTLAVFALPAMDANAAGLCANTGSDAWIDYVWYNNSTRILEAEGAWKTTGASSARLQYYVDGVLFQTSYLNGTAGSWNSWSFSDNYSDCGNHTFKVKVCPRVWENGGFSVCEQHCTEESDPFVVDHSGCYPDLVLDVDCSLSGPNGVVGFEADILSGNPNYKIEYYTPSSWWTKYSSTSSTGTFTYSNRCSYAGYKIGIRVTDSKGQQEHRFCYCNLLP